MRRFKLRFSLRFLLLATAAVAVSLHIALSPYIRLAAGSLVFLDNTGQVRFVIGDQRLRDAIWPR